MVQFRQVAEGLNRLGGGRELDVRCVRGKM